MATFPSTVFQGSRASDWNMKLTPLVIPCTRRPPTQTSPADGVSSPATSASVVDFPQPVGPTTAQNCPGSTTKFTSRTAVKTAPDGVANRFATPDSSTRDPPRPGSPPGASPVPGRATVESTITPAMLCPLLLAPPGGAA